MSSSRRKIKRRISIVGVLFWTGLIAAVWFIGRIFLPDNRCYDYVNGLHGITPKNGDHIQLVPAGKEIQMESYTVEHRELICPTVGMVELNNASCAASFAALPLGPQDMAVLLNRLKQAGVQDIALSSPLTWQQETGDMSREMFCRVMQSFPHAVAGLRGRTAAQPDFTPLELRQSAIPAENVQGDARGLPIANRPLPNSLTSTPDSLAVVWAPDWLQDEPHTHKPSAVEKMSFPLLVRWNGETIPTLPFRLALMRLGLKSEDVQVKLGESITYGGVTRPLDRHGRTRIEEAKVISLPLSDVVSGNNIRETLGENSCVVMEEPAPKQDTPRRLERLALTVSQLAGTEKITYETAQRIVGGHALQEFVLLSGWKQYSIAIVSLLLILFILPRFHGLLRWPILLSIPAWLLWEAWQVCTVTWVPISTLLSCWLLFLIAVCVLKPTKKGLFDRM